MSIRKTKPKIQTVVFADAKPRCPGMYFYRSKRNAKYAGGVGLLQVKRSRGGMVVGKDHVEDLLGQFSLDVYEVEL